MNQKIAKRPDGDRALLKNVAEATKLDALSIPQSSAVSQAPTYAIIKQAAKDAGLRIDDLLALAPKNDPFYTGRPSELAAAEWFTGQWHGFGYADGVHLRRIHYRLVSQKPPVTMPDGKPYANTEACWDYLNDASKWARYLDLVTPGAFVDRRNPDAILYARFLHPGHPDYIDPKPRWEVEDRGDDPFAQDSWETTRWELPELPELSRLRGYLPSLPDFDISGYRGLQQPYLVEVWAEKTTMNDILTPLCQRYKVNLVTGAGELSITAVILFLERVRRARRPARILYVSDYDPAGMGMPVSVARKVEYYQRHEGQDGLDIKLDPIILTAEQATDYDLPRTPIKDTDARKATWEATHGQGATELDALEALHPGELARIVEAAILGYYDRTLQRRAEAARDALVFDLDGLRDEAIESYQDELDAIEADYDELRESFEETRQKFTDLVRDFQPEIDAHAEDLEAIKERYREVYGKVYEDLDAIELEDKDEYALPEPELPEESEDLLYDSRRDYWQQLDFYKAHRGGNGE